MGLLQIAANLRDVGFSPLYLSLAVSLSSRLSEIITPRVAAAALDAKEPAHITGLAANLTLAPNICTR